MTGRGSVMATGGSARGISIGCAIVLLALPFPACSPDLSLTGVERVPDATGQGSHRFITGQVVDASGNPITKFEYLVRGGAVTENERAADGSLLAMKPASDPKGEFRARYSQVHGQKQTIVVGAPGHVTRYHIFDTTAPDALTNVSIVLDRAAGVKGKVVDVNGDGVPGALIWIGPVPRPRHHGRPGAIAETDKRGRFFSDRFPSGTTTLGVLHRDHPATSFDVNLSLSEKNRPVLELPSGVALSGSMRFGEAPVRDGRIFVETKAGGRSGTPADGAFQLKGVPPDVTHVDFYAFRFESTGEKSTWYLSKPVDLVGREELNVDVQFPVGTATLTGQILLGGHANEYGGSLYLTPLGESGKMQISAHANGQGRYAISEMPEGDWMAHADLYDKELGGFNSRQQVTTRAGQITDLTIDFPLNDG